MGPCTFRDIDWDRNASSDLAGHQPQLPVPVQPDLSYVTLHV